MFQKRLASLMLVCILGISLIACGDKTSSNVQETSVASTELAQDNYITKSSEQNKADKEAAEELSRKAEEIKSSMAAAVDKAAKEAESYEAAAKMEAEAQEAESRAEAEAQVAAMQQAALKVANQAVGADDEVVTVIDDYGIESARLQYGANYAVYVELLRLTNELRESMGLDPLVMDDNMSIAACKKAVDYYLAGYYDGDEHKMIDGRPWTALFSDFNIGGTSIGENLAQGTIYKTARQMFEGWKNSPIHYKHMVSPKYTRAGIGTCGYIWFMDFAN